MWFILSSNIEKDQIPIRTIDITFVSKPLKISFNKEYNEDIKAFIPVATGDIPEDLKYEISSKVFYFCKSKLHESSEEEIHYKMLNHFSDVYVFFVKYLNRYTGKEEIFFSSLFSDKEYCMNRIKDLQEIMNKIICTLPKISI